MVEFFDCLLLWDYIVKQLEQLLSQYGRHETEFPSATRTYHLSCHRKICDGLSFFAKIWLNMACQNVGKEGN
jgi:hypothetical protein